MASRPRRSAVARSTAVRSTTTGAGAASVSPASAFDNAADITRAREILSRFRCDRRVHSGDCMRDVAIASRARARDAIVDIKSQIFDGETMLAQTVATAASKQWVTRYHDAIAAPKGAKDETTARPHSGPVRPRAACTKHIDHNESFPKQRVIARGG